MNKRENKKAEPSTKRRVRMYDYATMFWLTIIATGLFCIIMKMIHSKKK